MDNSKQVEKLADLLSISFDDVPLSRKDVIDKAFHIQQAKELMFKGWIHKSSALDHVEVCFHCWGGYNMRVDNCDICDNKGIVLKEKK